MKIIINYKKIVYSIGIPIVYILLNRTLNIYFFGQKFSVINSIYTLLSQGMFIVVVFIYLLRFKIMQKNWGLFFPFVLLCFTLFISTFMNDGNIRRWFSTIYPIAGIFILISLCCYNMNSTKKFIHAMSNFYFVIVLINLLCMLFIPNTFGSSYLIGIENQISITLCIGFLYVALDGILNQKTKKIIIYTVIYVITSVLIFSGSGMLSMIFLVVVFLIKPVGVIMEKLPLSFVTTLYVGLLILISMNLISVILNLPIITYIIEEVLGKNTTLTSRTYIWETLFENIINSPMWGYGIADSTNLFTIESRFGGMITLSAHNQFLQTLYEGGMVSFFLLLFGSYYLSRKMLASENLKVVKVLKMVIVADMIILFSEAAGITSYLQLIHLGLVTLGILKKNEGDKNSEKSNFSYCSNL